VTVCDANAATASFVRVRRLETVHDLVLARFRDNPEEHLEMVDARTIRVNLGTPRPLILSETASSYGPFVVSPVTAEANKNDDDP
jgi:peptide/nickel transport system substrate-binding protein